MTFEFSDPDYYSAPLAGAMSPRNLDVEDLTSTLASIRTFSDPAANPLDTLLLGDASTMGIVPMGYTVPSDWHEVDEEKTFSVKDPDPLDSYSQPANNMTREDFYKMTPEERGKYVEQLQMLLYDLKVECIKMQKMNLEVQTATNNLKMKLGEHEIKRAENEVLKAKKEFAEFDIASRKRQADLKYEMKIIKVRMIENEMIIHFLKKSQQPRSFTWRVDWSDDMEAEGYIVRMLNTLFDTNHCRLDAFTGEEREMIEKTLGQKFNWEGAAAIKMTKEEMEKRDTMLHASEISLKVSAAADAAAGALVGLELAGVTSVGSTPLWGGKGAAITFSAEEQLAANTARLAELELEHAAAISASKDALTEEAVTATMRNVFRIEKEIKKLSEANVFLRELLGL